MSCISILNYTENSRKNLLQAHYLNIHDLPKRFKLKKTKKRKIKVVQFQLQCLCELLEESKEFVEITKETKKSDLDLISQKVNISNEIILDSSTNFIDQKVNIDMNKDEENWEIWDLNTQHEKSADKSEILFVDSNNIEGELTHSYQLDSFEAKQLNVYASPTKFNNSVDLNDFNEIGKEDSKGFSKSFSYISKNSSNKENVKGKHSTSLNLDKFKQWFSPLKKSSSEERLTRSNKKSSFNEDNRLLVSISPPDSASSSQDKKQSYTITFKPENRINNNKASTVLNTATLQKSMLAITLGVGLRENQTNDAICNALLPHTVVERGEFSLGENIEPSLSDESGDKFQRNNVIDFSPFEDMNLSHPKFSTPEEIVQTNNPIISNNSKDSIDVNIRKQGSHIRALNFESDSNSTPISLDKNENEQILFNDQMASGFRITLQDTDAISSNTTANVDNVNHFYNHKLLEKDEGLSEDYLRDSRLDSFELHEMECMGTSSARSSPEKVPPESEDGRENSVLYHQENGENRKMTLELLNYMPSILERSLEHESESRDSLDGTLASKLFNHSTDVKKQSDLTSDSFLDECVEINIEPKHEDSTKCHLDTPVTNVEQSSSHIDLNSAINTKNYDSNASGNAANTQPCTCRDEHGCNHVDLKTNTKEDNEQSEENKKQITAEKQNFGDIKQNFNGTFEDAKNGSTICDLYDLNQYLIQKAAILQNDKSSLVFEIPIDKLENCLSNTKHFDVVLTPNKNGNREIALTLNKETETNNILTPDKNDKKEVSLTLNKENETNNILTPDKNDKKEVSLTLNKENETNNILTPDKNDKKEIALTQNKESETNDILTSDKNDKKEISLTLNKENETNDIQTPDKNDKKEFELALNEESETNKILTPDKNDKKEITLTLNKKSETNDNQMPDKNGKKEFVLALNEESETNDIQTPDKNDKKEFELALNEESETNKVLTPDKNDKKEITSTLNKKSETNDIQMPDKNGKKEFVLALNEENETNDIQTPDKNDKKEFVLALNKESETNDIQMPDKNDKKEFVLALNEESETNDKNDKKEITSTLNKESETNDILMSDKNDKKEIALALNEVGEENFNLLYKSNKNDEADVITRHFKMNEINGSLTSNTNDETDTTQKLNNCNEMFNSQNSYGSDTNVSTAQEFVVDDSKKKLSKKCLWYNYTEDEIKVCNDGDVKAYESDAMEKVLVVEANPVYNTHHFLTSHNVNEDDDCLKNQQSTCDIKSECKVLYKEIYEKEINSNNFLMTEKLSATSFTSSKTITSSLTTSLKTSLTTISTTSTTTFSTALLTTSTVSDMSPTITSPTALKISATTSPATSPTTKPKILSPITPTKISPSLVTTPPKISPITTFSINSPTTFATTFGISSLTTSFNASISTPPTTPAKISLASPITPPKISPSLVTTPPKISPSPVTTPPKIFPITTFSINSPTTFATTSGTSSLATSFNAYLSTPPTTPAKTSLASSITPTSSSFKICSKISPITSSTTASATISNRKLPMITSTVLSTSEATSSTKTTTFASTTSNEYIETNNVTIEEETIRECIVRVNNLSDNEKDDVTHSFMSLRNLPKSNFIDNEIHAIYPTSGDTNSITMRRIIKKKESLIWDNLLPQYEECNENITKESLQQISHNFKEENQINFVNNEQNTNINAGKKEKDFFFKEPKTVFIDTLPERKLDINEDINEACEKIPLNISTHNELQKTECNENCKSADFKNQLDLSFNSNMLQENKLHVNFGNKNLNDADVHNFVHVKEVVMDVVIDEQLFQSKSSELDAWVTSIKSSLSNTKEVAKLYAMLSLNYFQVINESEDKCQKDLDNRQEYVNKAKICIDKARALYNILKDNEKCSFESVIKYLLEFQEDCFRLSWPEINKNAQALIVFLNSVLKESDVITKHIQFVGELVANPKMYLYNLSTPRIELLKTCFFEELKHFKKCNDNDYLIKCFIMISRYFVLLDQPTTESLTKEYLLPFINEKNGAEFLVSIVTYMGLFKSNSKNMDITCDATTSLILLTIIFQNKNFDFRNKKDLEQFLEITAKQFQFCNQERLKLLHCIKS
ncbi:serine-rich adhesin for platelets isoform X5 [Hydra vulgaris]|uniref:Serine-rich adhesin for platelets isoform X5 n=1 Tax=Hydra vulgaris TaxID=6087 RepID=A0ABM4D2S5_HYDVU